MILHLKVLGLAILFLALCHHSPVDSHVEVASAASEDPDYTLGRRFLDKAKEGMTGSVAGTHYYWDKGLHIDSRKRNVRLKIGEKL